MQEKKLLSKQQEEKDELKKSDLEIFKANEVDLFKVVKTVGRGAQSEVFEVSRTQHFALKVFYISGADADDSNREKSGIFNQLHNLLQKYEILNFSNHKNIIRTYGFCYGDEKHSPSILLQYCPNNLNNTVVNMDDIERVCAIYEICEGMEAVHSANLIHGNLKPENILIDENGHIKLSDIELSCLIDDENASQYKNSKFGALKFTAPEILNENTNYNNKVDVYSFGVVAFFILTGGKMPKISMGEQSSGKKAMIPKNINKISRDLINKCWSFDPKDRPSFGEIIEYIKDQKFKLINGVEQDIQEINKFLSH